MSNETANFRGDQDRRSHRRVGLRTTVTTIVRQEDDTPQAFKAWTNDISPSGVRILCSEELPCDDVCLRIVLPGFENRLVMGRITHRQKSSSDAHATQQQPSMHEYGIAFIDFVPDDLIDAAQEPTVTETAS